MNRTIIRKHPLILCALVLLIAGAGLGLFLIFKPEPPIPPALKRDIAITVLLPQGQNSISINRATFKYDKALKLLTFTITMFGTPAIISQQATPETLIDVPKLYDKTIDDLHEYAKFDTGYGTVHLVQPPQLMGKQAAVINTKGTLMFVKPEKHLNNDQWRQFFLTLKVAD